MIAGAATASTRLHLLAPRELADVRLSHLRVLRVSTPDALRSRCFSQKVRAPTLVLHLGIRLSLQSLGDPESRLLELDLDGFRIEESEIDRDLVPPPFAEMNGFVPDVECEEERSTGSQHAVQLSERGGQGVWSEVNDRIESNDSRQALALHVERAHVALPELDPRVQLPRSLDHSTRQIDAGHVHAMLMQVPRELVVQLVEDAPDVLDGELRHIVLRLAVGAGCEQTWERCFLSLLDITDRKRAEDALRQSKEETILAHRSVLAKLSTPVIPISDRVIVMPLVGTLDRMRMEQVMTVLLDEVQRTRASITILDITGVPDIDAEATNGIILAAQAVRLLGAQVVLTGIQPVVARSLVDLGSDLSAIVTRSTLQTGISYAMHAEGSPARQS
jgi:anti-anti-sigma regulatory factor